MVFLKRHIDSVFLFLLFLFWSFGFGQDSDFVTNHFDDDYVTVNNLYSLPKDKPQTNNSLHSFYLRKADSLYSQLSYILAAGYYEKALGLSQENERTVLQKTGDCYYFNTEMEKAVEWYSKLFEIYSDSLSAESLFKYMHALKGVKKYKKAKKIHKLYKQALKQEKKRSALRVEEEDSILEALIAKEHLVDVHNLPINTRSSDFGPAYYQNGLAFSSSSVKFKTIYGWDGKPYLDLFLTEKQKDNSYSNPQLLSETLSTKRHEANAVFTKDEQTVYFTSNQTKRKYTRGEEKVNKLTLLKSTLVNGEWSEPEELPFVDKNYSFGHPVLSPDETKLYFVSDMPGSLGQTDIFVVDILGDNNYSSPRNLGEQINTSEREMFPYITDTHLYFASDGRVGLGGLDIFKSQLSNEGFSAAVNLGKPINSSRDDFSLIIKEDLNTGFFASNRLGGKGSDDIYEFKIKEVPLTVKGNVFDVITSEPIAGIEVQLLDQHHGIISTTTSDVSGNYSFTNLLKKPNAVSVEDSKYLPYSNDLEDTSDDTIVADIPLQKKVRKVTFDHVLFDFDKSTINPLAQNELDAVVDFLKENASAKIKIESHTDSRGSRDYNMKLSQRRAEATKNYLLSKGVSENQIISAVGYGEEQLLNTCSDGVPCSKADHQLNRRSEIYIID